MLQESKASSEIENIITTHDEIFKERARIYSSPAAKEVARYSAVLKLGFEQIKEQNILTNKIIKAIQSELVANAAGFRTQGGTTLKNTHGDIIYMPPQTLATLRR